MVETFKDRISGLLLSNRKHARYLRVFSLLALAVIVGVTGMLRMRGVAMTHEETVLDCQYTGNGAHTHDASCYDADGNLVCPLPEREYHVHDDSCYTTTSTLICGMEEGEGAHTHDETCYDADGNLICGLEETAGHVHDDSCYETVTELTCGKEEVTEEHVHGDGCFKTITVVDEEPAADAEAEVEAEATVTAAAEETEPAAEAEAEPEAEQATTDTKAETKAEKPAEPKEQHFYGDLKDADGNVVLAVAVKAPVGALPEGAYMEVKALNADEAADVAAKAEEAVKAESGANATVKRIQSVDITFRDAQGNEIEPTAKVEVKITSPEVRAIENPVLLHVDDDTQQAEVVRQVAVVNADENDTTTGNEDTLKFDADKFSPYSIVEIGQAEAEAKPAAEAPQLPAQDFEGKTGDVTVKVSAPEGAFPADTTMSVKPVKSDDVIESIEGAVTGSVKELVAVDITFLNAEGEQIQPLVPIKVTMTNAAASEQGAPTVVHVDDEGEASVVEQSMITAANDEVIFDADSFSIYAMVITTQYISASGEAYDVTVTYGPEAGIPEGAWLSVSEFEKGSVEWESARKAVLADKLAKGEYVNVDDFGFAALDISIMDGDKEIEPRAEVQVDLSIKSLPEVEDLSDVVDALEVQHHVETPDGVIVDTVVGGETESTFALSTVDDTIAAKADEAVDPTSFDEGGFDAIAPEAVEETLETSFDTEAFSTFTISWNGANGNGVKVHYVDENGTELNVANSVFPTTIGNNTSSPAHLIYDIDGYEYDHTYRRYYSSGRWNEQNIVPELRRYNGGWAYSTSGGNNSWNYLSASNAQNKDEIYVVYKEKADVTPGGSPTLKPVKPEDYPDEPDILKESEPNGDGTSDLSLSIVGHTKDREVEKLADVIVVFDVSGSMDYNLSGNTKRLAAAKTAVKSLVDNLAEKKNSDGNPLVRMSLISFSNTATPVIGLTDLTTSGVRDYKAAVEGLRAGGGTNWDYALQLANQQAVDSGRATFVIFVTDGDPTFRNTRTNISDAGLNGANNSYDDISESYYFNYHVFGTGSDDNRGNNYDAAVTQGEAIVAAKKNLYTIGISTDVKKVENFNTDAGGAGAFLAADEAGLKKAFDDIEAAIIAKLGVSDIQMTDGITEMTQTVDKSGLTTTDGSFTYWKKANGAATFVEWDPASEDALEAEYDEATGAVKWNMGTDFMPEDGATYKVTWKVWPSQEAYDILAKCMNDPTFYDKLTAAQKAQIARTGTAPNYSYTLRTNEPGAGTKYKSATKSGSGITTEGEYKELPFNEVDPLGLSSSHISIQKLWDNQLDGNTVTGEYTFPVKADGADFGDGVVLSSSQNPKWTNGYYISTGLMTTDPYVVYEHGHDYTIEEPSNLSYQWDFKSDVYHPMVINNQTVNLVKVDAGEAYDYEIDGKFYKALAGEAVLTATNERRSNLNISKTVVDKDGTHFKSDQVFTFTVTVDEGHDDEVWLSAYDTEAGTTVMDSSIVTGEGVQYQASDGYFHAPSGTTLTLTMKDGWNYRFTNLSVGSTYTIEENSPVPDGYTFQEIDASATNGAKPGTVTGQKTEGTIDKSNSVYTAAYTNRTNTTTLKFRKVGSDGNTPLADAVVAITKDNVGVGGSPFTTTAEDIELTLLDGVYRVKETKAPAGYNILSGEYYFKTSNGTVTITDASGNTKSYGEDFTKVTEDGTIVLKLKNTPGAPLPTTGGPGTTLFTTIGAAVMATAVGYGFASRRRREGRSDR